MKKILNEFIGSFFWTLSMVMCLLGNADQYTGLAVGAMLMVLVFAGGHLSGAHYNPVVTVAVWLRGKCSVSDVPIYIFAQLIGAAIAAIVVDSVLLQKLGELNFPKSGLFPTFGSEFLGSFVIVYVLLNVATAKDTAGNSFYGLAVGGCLMACIYSFGNLSGGAFSPAVSLGMAISKIIPFSSIWIYWIAVLLGGILVAFTFLFVNGKD